MPGALFLQLTLHESVGYAPLTFFNSAACNASITRLCTGHLRRLVWDYQPARMRRSQSNQVRKPVHATASPALLYHHNRTG